MKNIISLNRNEQFLQVYKKGKRTYHRNFTLHFLPNQLETNRLGIKAGKKLAKAVRRNRVRRLIKEAYRLLQPDIATGYDLVIVAKDSCLLADSLDETMAALHHLFKHARLLIKNSGAQSKQAKQEEAK